jgi:RHS repeat-associated protein
VRGDDLLATLRPDEAAPTTLVARYFHAEGIGSIRALTDLLGNASDRYEFEAFGTLLDHQGDEPNAYLFAGEPLDPNSNFYYNRARWTDPISGRFVSSDVFTGLISEPLTLHKYLYAGADPAGRIDPSGLFSISESLTVLAVKGINFAIRHPYLVGFLGFVANILIPQEFHDAMIGMPNPLAHSLGALGQGEIRFYQLVKSQRFRSFMNRISRRIAGRFWKDIGDKFEDVLAARLLKGAERQIPVNPARKIRIDFRWREFLIEAKTSRSLDAGDLEQLAEAAKFARAQGLGLSYFFLIKPTKGTIEAVKKAGGTPLWFFGF